MILDENGYSIEQPDIPIWQHIHYIVKDYRRMYMQQGKLERKCRKLRETNSQMAHYNFFMRKTVQDQIKVVDHLVKMLQNRGCIIPSNIQLEIENFRKIAYPQRMKGKRNWKRI